MVNPHLDASSANRPLAGCRPNAAVYPPAQKSLLCTEFKKQRFIFESLNDKKKNFLSLHAFVQSKLWCSFFRSGLSCLALCRYAAPSSHDIFLADHFKVWFGILNRWLLVRKPHASSVIHDLRSPSVGTCCTAHRPAERVRHSTWNRDRNPTISAMSNPSSK